MWRDNIDRRFFIYNPIIEYQPKRIDINSPNICPFCGNRKIAGTFKIWNRLHSSFINTFVCEEHLKLKMVFSWKVVLYYISLIIALCFLFFSRNLIAVFITLMVVSTLLILGFGYIFIQEGKKNAFIKDFIKLETFKEGFVISVKKTEWAEEFKTLNSCLELKIDDEDELIRLDDLSARFTRIQKKISVIVVITFILTMVTLFTSFNYASAVLYLISQISLGFFVLSILVLTHIFLYENGFKMEKKRSKIYFKFFK